MRLASLDPHWITPQHWADSNLFAVGVSFFCPHCDPSLPEHGENRRRRLAVMFYPPVDVGALQAKYGPGWWPKRAGDHQRVSGETFDTLTIEPSIGFDSIGHWHGRITNGECAP